MNDELNERTNLCVNACDGISSAALEAGVVADLLATCESLAAMDCHNGDYLIGDAGLTDLWRAVRHTRKAMAKLKSN